MISYRFQKNMSFTACCWKSWRIKEKHVEFWGAEKNLQVSWVPPLHLQANILPFNHPYWWQSHIACVWLFRFLVSPSSRKTEKKNSPWLENNKNYHFAGICGRFAGRSCRKKRLSVTFVVFANHCAFRIHLGCHKAPRCSAEQILICLMHLYVPSTSGSNW